MTDDEDRFKQNEDDGLDEETEATYEEYLVHIAETILGLAGRVVTASKEWYDRANPGHVSVFNARVCIDGPPRMIWYGDLDATLDEKKLAVLAKALDMRVYVLEEQHARFRGAGERPRLGLAVLAVSPDGRVEHAAHICRDNDGRLKLKH